ncbi:apolipoprotein C1 [Homo sapiens]|uniref:Apolipoprotein C1 n=1 Tax=Homo sapiens TaxID=9606 RepID=K7ELM9_HUMAN|nr:apolipoprotein C1 [Homo sapiens]KAI4043303.1 apolipoprotein C1 [Homo sapiens]
MRLFLSLPVLVVVLSIVLEGPAPAQGTPDVSSALDKLKEFGNTLEDKARELISRIKQSELSAKMRLEPFPGHGRAGGVVFRDISESEGETQD